MGEDRAQWPISSSMDQCLGCLEQGLPLNWKLALSAHQQALEICLSSLSSGVTGTCSHA